MHEREVWILVRKVTKWGRIFGTDVVSADEVCSGKQLSKQFAVLQIFTTIMVFFLHKERKRPGICENPAEIRVVLQAAELQSLSGLDLGFVLFFFQNALLDSPLSIA